MSSSQTREKGRSAGFLKRVTPIAIAVGAVLAIVGFVLAFTHAPLVNGAQVDQPAVIGGTLVDHKLLLSQKIFYWHVPVAVASYGALIFAAIFSIRYLVSRDLRFDARAKVATEVALAFVLCTMASGEMWTRYEWGVWWSWEPRLTTYLILMLLVIAYFVLRTAIEDPERRGVYAAVLNIFAFIDVPISFMVTRLIPSSIHPVVFRTDSGLPPDMLLPFLISMFGMALLAFGFYQIRIRTQKIEDRIEYIQNTLED